ncbi:deubiquitinase OTUD6B-like [Lampetra fluviatilis]
MEQQQQRAAAADGGGVGSGRLPAQEELSQRHKREKRELQGRVQAMKNAVPKNDKKRRKQLADEVAQTEAELEARHERERLVLAGERSESQAATVGSVLDALASVELTSVAEDAGKTETQLRVSKAQKRRDKKAASEREREARIATAELNELTHGARHLEGRRVADLLAARGLHARPVPPDGHCMYAAVRHQLEARAGPALSVAELRACAASYIRQHRDEFAPFLTQAGTGEAYTDEEFDKYCDEVEKTAAWGGQLELRALSHALEMPLEVVQASAPPITIGDEYHVPPITLIYMRHAYGLGEHYDSVEPIPEGGGAEGGGEDGESSR